MDREDLQGDPAFPYSTNYNYYAGSSHLQQFPYYDYSMPLASWPPPSLDHEPGYSLSTEPPSVNDATNGSGSDNEDCVEVHEVQVSSYIKN